MLPVSARNVRDQLSLESCVSCAAAAAMEARDARAPVLSAMSHYRLARVERRFGSREGRLTLTEGIATLESSGISSERLHDAPMTATGFEQPLSADATAEALRHRLTRRGLFPAYELIGAASRVIAIRRHLKAGRPVLMGFTLPREYPHAFLEPGHIWDNPRIDFAPDGHCVVVIGFDDVKQALRIQDSRGMHARFDKGCWWMGYAVADSNAIVAAAGLG
jgi:hypothetical protein